MLLPLVMVFLQVGWGHYLGTEDLLIEDCMKLKKEPKTVLTIYFNVKIRLIIFFFLSLWRQWLVWLDQEVPQP